MGKTRASNFILNKMIKRTRTQTAVFNYRINAMMRIFFHCVISVTVAFLCSCVNINGEEAQLIEKVENKTNDYKQNPLQIFVKEKNTVALNPFVQPFTEENIPNISSNISSRNYLKSLALDDRSASKVQYKRRRKPYRRRRKLKRKKLSRNNLRFIQRYQDIQNDIDILNAYPNYRRGYLKKQNNIRAAQSLNIRQRKSFRSRTKNSSYRANNDIFFHRSKYQPSPSETSYSKESKTTNYSNSRERKNKGTKSKRPNVILMMADDQDVELGSLQFMPKLNRYLRGEGAHLESGFVTTPMCCPSRSSILTGLYAHNHHVLTNNDNCSSTDWVEQHEPRTFATYMKESGYKTGYFGKYLNKYAGNHIPVGWDEWAGLIRNSRFYNYSVNVNGIKVKHGSDYERDYYPDLITNDSLAFFRQSKQQNPEEPILMVMSYPGPHGPEDSAPQYSDLFFNVTTHHNPSYDYAPNPDKQWILQVVDRMEPIHKKFTDTLMTKRLQTLQSIDEGIERLYHELELLGELDNTYIVYTSDHGYHLGQFGLVKGKGYPFDVDTKVPFFIRGPNIDGGTVFHRPVLNIDLAPTFLDIANIDVPNHMDGKSLLPTVLSEKKLTKEQETKKSRWRDSFLIERGKMTIDRYNKIRNSLPPSSDNPWDKLHHTIPLPEGPASLFDQESKTELESSTNKISGFTDDLQDHQLIFQKSRLTKQERLAVECLKPKYQGPCKMFQKRKCVRRKNTERGLWKMVRCRGSGHNNFLLMSTDNSFTSSENDVLYPTENYDSYLDENGKCMCGNDGNMLESVDGSSTRSLARTERKRQRDFLKKHTTIGMDSNKKRRKRKHRKRKLNYAADSLQKFNTRLRSELGSNRRIKRETLQTYNNLTNIDPNYKGTSEIQEITGPSEVTKVLKEIAEEQIDEVDIIMEDITDEIKDLQEKVSSKFDNSNENLPSNQITNDTKKEIFGQPFGEKIQPSSISIDYINQSIASTTSSPACEFSDEYENDENCKTTTYSSIPTWKSSKSYINEQIRRLRAQLFELKEIRRYLKNNKPYTFNNGYDTLNNVWSSSSKQENPNGLQTWQPSDDNFSTMNRTEHNSKISCTCPISKRRMRNPNVARKSQLKHMRQAQKQRVRQARQERKARIKMERLQKRLKRKERRKQKRDRKARKERRKKKLEFCNNDNDRLQCFSHNNEHWKTAPFWTDGPFCACTNSNTNTYWCVRTVNITHNYLYCEFVSGIITYYNLNIDPYQLRNIYQTLSDHELNSMHRQLLQLKNQNGDSNPDQANSKKEQPASGSSGHNEPSFTSSESPYNASDESDWSWPFGERNFDDSELYDWPVDDEYISSSRRHRTHLKSARKAERKRKAEERLQRKFIKRYGKILPPPEAYTKTPKSRRRQKGNGKERKYMRNNN